MRSLWVPAAICTIASLSSSNAAALQNLRPKEEALAALLLRFAESKGYQPGYGFGHSSGGGQGFSDLLSVVGGHGSLRGPSWYSSATLSAGGGSYGFSESLGALSISDGASLTIAFPPANLSGTSWNLIGNSSGSSGVLTLSSGNNIWSGNQVADPGSILFLDPSWSVSTLTLGTILIRDGATTLVPEPSTLLLGSLGSLALFRRRRAA